MLKEAATVIIIDADASFCRATKRLIASARLGAEVETFCAPALFFRRPCPSAPSCLLLETRLPEISGLEVQQHLAQADIDIPLIFVTGYGDIPMAVQALKAGAVDFLTKPVQARVLLDDIQQAWQRDATKREQRRLIAALRSSYRLLTPCEREVFTRVATGLLNKQVAAELGITEKTVKFHRGHIMRKMRASSVVDLSRMAERLALIPDGLRGAGLADGLPKARLEPWNGPFPLPQSETPIRDQI